MASSKSIIQITEDNCAGCLICQLICSFIYHKIFSTELAQIQINSSEYPPRISFLEGCTQCFQCVDHCLYGALKLQEEPL
ncbi:MAG: 4Fe-4S dicluster domain-containing protein [Candidatus Helarchaeota archaeon]